ncbi:arginase family protein [Phormidium yuhuli]|uniref:arginase family protein n=1 Tax=Phormidium yuhuli TaxID=2974039 RepID=UPI0035A8A815
MTAEQMLQDTQTTVAEMVAAGKFVLALGGEHSITAGLVAGYRQVYGDEPFTVVQIDAHGDLRDVYEGSKYNHACVMHRILEMGLPSLPVGIQKYVSSGSRVDSTTADSRDLGP